MAEIAFKYWHDKEQSAAVSKKGSKTPPLVRAKPKRISHHKSALVDLDDGGTKALPGAPWRWSRPEGTPGLINTNMTLPSVVYGDTDRVPRSAPPTVSSDFVTRSIDGRADYPDPGLVKDGPSTRRSLYLDDRIAPPALPPQRPPLPKTGFPPEVKQEQVPPPPPRKITPAQPAESPRKTSRGQAEGERRRSSLFLDDMSTSSSSSSPTPSMGDASSRASSLSSWRHPRFPALPRSQTVTRERGSPGEDASGKTTPRSKRISTKSESFVSYVDEVEKGQVCNGATEVGLVLLSVVFKKYCFVYFLYVEGLSPLFFAG